MKPTPALISVALVPETASSSWVIAIPRESATTVTPDDGAHLDTVLQVS